MDLADRFRWRTFPSTSDQYLAIHMDNCVCLIPFTADQIMLMTTKTGRCPVSMACGNLGAWWYLALAGYLENELFDHSARFDDVTTFWGINALSCSQHLVVSK